MHPSHLYPPAPLRVLILSQILTVLSRFMGLVCPVEPYLAQVAPCRVGTPFGFELVAFRIQMPLLAGHP